MTDSSDLCAARERIQELEAALRFLAELDVDGEGDPAEAMRDYARAALAPAEERHVHRYDLWPDEPNKYCEACHPAAPAVDDTDGDAA